MRKSNSSIEFFSISFGIPLNGEDFEEGGKSTGGGGKKSFWGWEGGGSCWCDGGGDGRLSKGGESGRENELERFFVGGVLGLTGLFSCCQIAN